MDHGEIARMGDPGTSMESGHAGNARLSPAEAGPCALRVEEGIYPATATRAGEPTLASAGRVSSAVIGDGLNPLTVR